jgi:dihydropteroate synthase
VQQELDRVMPVIEALRGASVPLSIDTTKPEVMRAALAAGASMVNDINALQHPGAMEAVAATHAAVCLMHKQGTPQTMQVQPEYQDVVTEVKNFLQTRITAANAAGITNERIIIDPGFGFGKTLAHNLELLRNLEIFANMGVPLLAGLSRKSMLGGITGQQDATQRVHASVVAAVLAVERGAHIVRVHDVRATVEGVRVWEAVVSR